MIYEFRGPGALKGYTATEVGQELNRIYERDGRIEPRTIVDEARPDMSALHNAFEWDDGVAAERFREVQARQIVRSIVLVAQPERHETAPTIRAYVSLAAPTPDSQTHRIYKPAMEALRDPRETEEVQRRLRRELLSLRQRYLDVLEISEILQAAQEVMAAV